MKRFIFFSSVYAGTAALLKVGGFLLSLWMARSLEVTEFGNYGVFFAIQTGVATFGIVGVYESVVGLLRECDNETQRLKLYSDAKNIFQYTIGITLVIALAVVLLVGGWSRDWATLVSVLISGALLAYASLHAQIIRLEERHISSLVFSFAVPATALVSGGIGFGITRTVEGFFIGSCLGLVFSSVISARFGLRETAKFTSDNFYQKKLFARLLPYVAVAFFGWMSGYGNNLVIAKIFNNDEIARFTFAMSVAAIMQLIASALNQVWSPHFLKIVYTLPINEVESKNRRFFLVQGVILGVMAIIGIVVFPYIMDSIGGNLTHYGAMQLEFFFLFAGYIVLIPWWHCSNYFLVHDKGANVMKITLATSFGGVALWILLMWVFGAIGIYIGFFAQMLLRSIGIDFVARRLWVLNPCWAASFAGISLAGFGLLLTKI